MNNQCGTNRLSRMRSTVLAEAKATAGWVAYAVADRGLLSIDNLEALQAMRLPNGKPLEFILAVPGRRYAEFAELLAPVNAQAAQSQAKEIVAEASWEGLRLVIAHDRDRAMEQSAKRDETIAKLRLEAVHFLMAV
ncbi:MAG: hypothetical protein EBW39_12315 [Betaproteobacteria bacterium]|nr:hypothetical protein [Betaproteobacteria bacterium]